MTIEAELHDGRVLEFPDGTAPEVVQATVKKALGVAPQRRRVSWGDYGAALNAGEAMGAVNDFIDRQAYKAGGAVTDAAAKVLPPEAAAAAGYVTNVGLQAAPMLFGGEAAKLVGPVMRKGAETLMQSALKPGIDALKDGSARKAISTMLDEGISVTQGGVEKLRGQIDNINDAITAKLRDNPATIEAFKVVRGRLEEMKDRVMRQVTPNADIATVEKAVNEFLNHPLLQQLGDIPVKLAQEMKQGTYRALGGKSYGELKGADTEAQKMLARGLKEEIASAVPGIGELNAHESALLNALEQVQHRALMEGNKNTGGLAWLAKNPAAWTAFMADKSSAFKSIVARMINAGQEQLPATAARSGVGLYEAGSNMKEGRP